VAYAVDTAGNEIYTIQVKNLTTGAVFADAIPNATNNLQWANDNATLFYTTLDAALPAFTPSAAETEAVRAIISTATHRNAPPPLLLLNANCSDMLPLRKWADANYVELARQALARAMGCAADWIGLSTQEDGFAWRELK
jgi:hypothetical protein